MTLSGCEPARSPSSRQAAVLSPYTGAVAQLFDDSIAPSAVGIASVAASPRTDPVLRARTQRAEVVEPVRISTVTIDTGREAPIYHLGLTAVGAPLSGTSFANPIDLSVTNTSQAFLVVKSLDAGLIGHTFIGFFRRFAGADEPDVHWHLAPNDAETTAAVREASTLSELGNRGASP